MVDAILLKKQVGCFPLNDGFFLKGLAFLRQFFFCWRWTLKGFENQPSKRFQEAESGNLGDRDGKEILREDVVRKKVQDFSCSTKFLI